MANRSLLYYITDRTQFRGDRQAQRQALLDKINEAVRAGVDYIQLREKDLPARELERLAIDVRAVLALAKVRDGASLRDKQEHRTRLLINSRTDIALATGADGVHLHADDVEPHQARKISSMVADRQPIADAFLVAVSCHSVEDVMRAHSEAADFVVYGPVFGKQATRTQATGPTALREACRANIPVLALGGVTLNNAASCLEAGATGIAGIRLFQNNKIEDVVRTLRAL